MSVISISSSSDDGAASPFAAVAALARAIASSDLPDILIREHEDEIELHSLSHTELQHLAVSAPSWIHCDSDTCMEKLRNMQPY
jgi:hypothetical protein